MTKRRAETLDHRTAKAANPGGQAKFSLGRIGRGHLLAAGLATLAAAFLFASPAADSADGDFSPPLAVVEAFEADLQPGYTRHRSFLGRVEAARSSDLGFELSGLIRRVLVNEGDTVSEGQLLAVLDSRRLSSRRRELVAGREQQAARLREALQGPRREEIEEARAAVLEREARMELAEANRRRSLEAFQLDAIAEQEWDQARLDHEAVSQQLEAARQRLARLETGTRAERIEAQRAVVDGLDAQIASLDVDIRKSSLRAPFAGTIAARLADEGEVLTTGQTVLRLLEDGDLEARVGVASDQARLLVPGASFPLRASDRHVKATVKSVLPDVREETRTVDVILALDPVGGLRDGDLVELALEETVPASGFWLPLTALTESLRGLWAAYALAPNPDRPGSFRLERRELEVLATENDRVYVQGTLRDGEQVVASGVHRLTGDQTVSLAAPLLADSSQSPAESP